MDLGSCGECKAPVPDPSTKDFNGWSRDVKGIWKCHRCHLIEAFRELVSTNLAYLLGRTITGTMKELDGRTNVAAGILGIGKEEE